MLNQIATCVHDTTQCTQTRITTGLGPKCRTVFSMLYTFVAFLYNIVLDVIHFLGPKCTTLFLILYIFVALLYNIVFDVIHLLVPKCLTSFLMLYTSTLLMSSCDSPFFSNEEKYLRIH